MNPQQTMDAQATLRATFARFMDGSPSEKVVAELTEMGASQEAAQEVVARAVVILSDPRVREVVASIERDGTSAADAWEAITSSGVDRDAAQALVAEIVERSGRVEQKHRLVEEDWRRRKREADLDEARSLRKEGRRKIIFGVILLLPASLFVIADLTNVWSGAAPRFSVLVCAFGGIIYMGIGISRRRSADALEMRVKQTKGGGG